MKGQFLMISAVIVGVMVISIGSAISETQSREFSNDNTVYKLDSIREEASTVDMGSPEERENFQRMVEMIDSHSSETVYWSKEQCFNVTLVKSNERIELHCIS